MRFCTIDLHTLDCVRAKLSRIGYLSPKFIQIKFWNAGINTKYCGITGKHALYIVGKHKKPVSDPGSAFDKNRIWCSAQNTWCSARSKWAFISSIWEYASPFGVLYRRDVSGSYRWCLPAKPSLRLCNAAITCSIFCVCFWIRITWAWNNSLVCFG